MHSTCTDPFVEILASKRTWLVLGVKLCDKEKIESKSVEVVTRKGCIMIENADFVASF